MSEIDDDNSGLPVPPGDGADDPGIDSPQPEGNPYAPMDYPVDDSAQGDADALKAFEWQVENERRFDDILKQLLELRAIVQQQDAPTGGGTLEKVTLTLASGTGGTITPLVLANFKYNFTDSTNIAHASVVPAHQRLPAMKKALIGLYDRVADSLIWTDEVQDAGGCT